MTTEVDISNQPNNLADNAKIKQMVKEVCDQQYAELRGFVEGFLASGKLPDEVVSLARKIVDQHPISCENCGNIVGLSKPNKKTRNGRVL